VFIGLEAGYESGSWKWKMMLNPTPTSLFSFPNQHSNPNPIFFLTYYMKKDFKNCYVFVLGRETKIALLELEQVLRRFDFDFSIITVSGNLAYINISADCPLPITDLIRSLGGTIKIFKVIGSILADKIADKVSGQILEEKANQGGKIKFGLSNFSNKVSRKDIQDIGIKIKMGLKSDLSIRYIENREGGDLQPIVSAKNKLDSKGIEFGFFECHPEQSEGSRDSRRVTSVEPRKTSAVPQNDNEILLAKLITVYDPMEWSKRDYGKPESDKYSGMMPPKLARALINITLGDVSINDQLPMINQLENDSINENCPKGVPSGDKLKIENCADVVVVDPFCGSGNILIEALSLGFDVTGSDISEKAVEDTKANLGWLLSQNSKSQTLNSCRQGRDLEISASDLENIVFQADATSKDLIDKFSRSKNLSTCEPKNLIIVAEPYLGKPKKEKSKVEDLKAEITELKKLYLDFLKNVSKLVCHSVLDTESIQMDSRVKPENDNGVAPVNPSGLKVIALVFPLFELENGDKYSLFSEAVDEIKELGYTPIRTLVYGRAYQMVKREIVWLEPNK